MQNSKGLTINNPYLYHPHPLCKAAAGVLFSSIANNPEWSKEFSKGKMLGILIVRNRAAETSDDPQVHYIDQRIHYINNVYSCLFAYSGIVDIAKTDYFVPPVYDLTIPDDFYKEGEKQITAINQQIARLEQGAAANKHQISELKRERKAKSAELQNEIFRHFNFCNAHHLVRNVVDIFADAKRGLPPGGTGECAAPRLLQYANQNDLEPVALSEVWYGESPKGEVRVHGLFYPSCIDKCSPLLKFMADLEEADMPDDRPFIEPEIIYQDENIIALDKPAGDLSVPGKDLSAMSIETWLHTKFPDVKGPMLVHRLDQGTSGIMLAAKDADTFKKLQADFADRKIHKTYLAWLDGILKSECGIINLPLCPNPDDRPRQTIDRQYGKTAITRYEVISRTETATLVAFYPLTGRTHQLRMHAASPFGLDLPIIGDTLYNLNNEYGNDADSTLIAEKNTLKINNSSNRLMLRAKSINFFDKYLETKD